MNKPNILVARAIFPETIARLEQHFEVEHNQADQPWSKQILGLKLAGKVGVGRHRPGPGEHGRSR